MQENAADIPNICGGTEISTESREKISKLCREESPTNSTQSTCSLPILENMNIQMTPTIDPSTNSNSVQSTVGQNLAICPNYQPRNSNSSIHSIQTNLFVININDNETETSSTQSTVNEDVPSSVQGVSQSSTDENDNEDSLQGVNMPLILTGFMSSSFWSCFICFGLSILKITNYEYLEILCFLLTILVFDASNEIFKREVVKQRERSKVVLISNFVFIFGTLVTISLLLEKIPIYICERNYTFVDFFWSIVFTDYVIKLITILFKTTIALLSASFLHFNKRGKYYQLMEGISQVCRALISTFPWLRIFMGYGNYWHHFWPIVCILLYAILKIFEMKYKIVFLMNSVLELWQTMNLGFQPTEEELSAIDGQCVICYENFSTPIKLRCQHIFCETCVFTWLEKEHTCPLCRAVIVKVLNTGIENKYTNGHTSKDIQLI